MIVNNIANLIQESDLIEEKLKIKWGDIISLIPIPNPFGMVGFLVIWVSEIIIRLLYHKYSNVEVSPKYLKYYSPLKSDFFKFLNIIEPVTNKFSTLRVAFKSNELECKRGNTINDELNCLLYHMTKFQLIKIQIILSTLYDDKVDISGIRTLEDIYVTRYTELSALNETIISLKNGLPLYEKLLIDLNVKSINEFGVPLEYTYKDMLLLFNKAVKQIIASSSDWR